MPHILTPEEVADFRNRVCDAAVELLAEFGHEGFNMRRLARQLGVSAMTTYRYFKDKNEILAAVRNRRFARLAERLAAAAHESRSAEERFLALARAYLEFAREEQRRDRSASVVSQSRATELQDILCEETRARAAFLAPAGVQASAQADENMDGLILWSALHGILSLNLAGKLSDSDCDRLISRAIRVLVRSFDPAPDFRSSATTPEPGRPAYQASVSGRNGPTAVVLVDQFAVP